MGVVYRARDRKLNRLVALKKIRDGPLASRTDRERFIRESEIVARLSQGAKEYISEILRDEFMARYWEEAGKLDK